MAKKFFVSEDFANRVGRTVRRVERAPQPRKLSSVPPPPAPPIVTDLFRVYNNSGETIPQYAVMQVEDLTERTGFSGTAEDAYSVTKPDGTGGVLFLINAGDEIEQGRFGAGLFLAQPNKVLIDDAGADPEFQDSYGPVEDQWHLKAGGIGFRWLGQMDEDAGTATFIEGLPADVLLVRNDSDETAPAHGVLRVTGGEQIAGHAVVLVDKPDATNSVILFNTGRDIASGAYGFALMDWAEVLYGTGTPAFDETWGPEDDSWELKEGNAGCKIIGGETTGEGKRVLVKLTGATKAYGGMYGPSDTNITNNTAAYTKMSVFGATYPASGMTLSTGSDNITIGAAGDYEIIFHAAAQSGSTIQWAYFLGLNGAGPVDGTAAVIETVTGTPRDIGFTTIQTLAAGDVLTIGYQGGDTTTNIGIRYPQWTVKQLG